MTNISDLNGKVKIDNSQGKAALKEVATEAQKTAAALARWAAATGVASVKAAEDVKKVAKETAAAGAEAEKAGKKVGGLAQEMKNFGEEIKKGLGFGAGFTIGAKVAELALTGLTAGIRGAVAATAELLSYGNKVGIMSDNFKRLASSVAGGSEAMLREARKGVKGLVADYDIMAASNKALLLGLPVTAKEFGTLSTAATALGRAMGQDAKKSLDDLITGLGRGSALILDNLGIVVNAEEAHQKYAASIGKTAESLSEAEKKLAVYKEAVRSMGENMNRLGDVNLTASDRLQQVNVMWQNLYGTIGAAIQQSPSLNQAMGEMVGALQETATWVEKNRTEMVEFVEGGLRTMIDMMRAGKEVVSGFFSLTGIGEFSAALDRLDISKLSLISAFIRERLNSATWGVSGGIGLIGRMLAPEEEEAGPSFGGVQGGGSSTAIDAPTRRRAQVKLWAEMDNAQAEDHVKNREQFYRDMEQATEAAAKKVERLAEEERRLFEQRSDALAKTANIQGAFWNMNPERYQTTGLDVPQGPNGGPKFFNMWGDSSKFMPPELEGNIHVVYEAQEKARESANRWAGALQGVALMAGAIGGKIGATAQVMANIAESFKGFSAMDKFGKFNAIAGGVGQIGGLVGGTGGSAIQGAAGGAMAGFSIGGPIGAAIGGVAGGIMGLFGGKSKAKAELADLKTQLSTLSDEAKKFGINLDSAFASKNSSVVKAAIDSVNGAVKESEKRIAGLSTAAGGLNSFAKGGAITDQASSDRAGMYAGAIFGGQLKESGDVVGALKAIGPALAEMAAKAKEFGYSLGEGVTNLIGMSGILEGDSGLADQVSGLNQLMKGLTDAGMVTKDMFSALGADASAVFARLIDGGATGNQALTLMQPTLQQLYEGQKLHGYAVDEATQALLDQAKAEGIVGDAFMSANERIVELLGILIEAVGGKLPEAYRRAGDAADEYRRKGSNLPFPVPDPDPGDAGNASGAAFRNYGAGTRTTLHGEEAVLTRPQVDRLVGMAVAGVPVSTAAGGGGRDVSAQPIVIHNYLTMPDGRVLLSATTQAIRSEGRDVQEFRSALNGDR